MTVNRNCASSLQAINDAAMSIAANCEDVQIAGGVEHMDHVPMSKDYTPFPGLNARHGEAIMNMGLTAEYLAAKYRISRKRQDEFALRSHQLAAEATDAGLFRDEIIPTWGRDDQGRKVLLDSDQCIRRDTSIESLAALPPAFNPAGGSVTAGNSSPINVGSAALLIMSEEKAKELGLKPMARIRSMAVAGRRPLRDGDRPGPGGPQGPGPGRDLRSPTSAAIELNEAFAVQVLSVLKLLGLSEEKVNTRGGVARDRPPARSQRRQDRDHAPAPDEGRRVAFGLATMCVGQGQGVATIFESSSRES